MKQGTTVCREKSMILHTVHSALQRNIMRDCVGQDCRTTRFHPTQRFIIILYTEREREQTLCKAILYMQLQTSRNRKKINQNVTRVGSIAQNRPRSSGNNNRCQFILKLWKLLLPIVSGAEEDPYTYWQRHPESWKNKWIYNANSVRAAGTGNWRQGT